jgi:hypothetical protein
VNNLKIPARSGSANETVSTNLGRAYRTTSGGNDGWTKNPFPWVVGSGVTLAVWVIPTAFSTDYLINVGGTHAAGLGYNASSNAQFRMSSGTQRSAVGATVLTANKLIHISGRCSPQKDVWLNGAQDGTHAVGHTTTTFSDVNIHHADGGFEAHAHSLFAMGWNYTIPDCDMVALYSVRHRWDLLQNAARTISLPAAAAAATTSTVIRTTKKSGARAPSHVTGINWASPLAEGLIHAVAGGYDSTARDLVTGEAMTLGTGTTRAAGKLGRALDFDGTSNATAKLSTTSFSDASPFTMASWFQLKDNLSNPTSSVSLHHGTDNDRWHVLAWSPGVPAFRFGVRDGGAYYPAVASYSPSAWELISQVGVVHGATDRRQYINGVEDGTVSNSVDVTLNSTTFFNLGTLHRVAQVNGSVLLHAAMVWDQRALSASDVAALYSPKYRWDIFQQGTRTISLPGAAASTGLTTIRRKL